MNFTRNLQGRVIGLSVASSVVVVIAGCGSSSSSNSAQSGTSGINTPSASVSAASVDKAFVREMVPHHESAVQMAKIARSQAQHQQIKVLAANIIRTQNAEIAKMTRIATTLGVTPGSAGAHGMNMHSSQMSTDAKALGLPMDQMGMDMKMSTLDGAKPFDRAFVDMMIPHHQGAIRMARADLARGHDARLRAIARGIIIAQAGEIGQMNGWRTSWFGSASPAGGVPIA